MAGSDGRLSITPQARKKLDSILKTVIKDVKPTESEVKEVTFYVNNLMSRLKKVAPKNVEIISVGSVARQTHMRGSHDIDIFLLFPRTMKEDAMEKKGVELAKKIVHSKNESYYIKYAEHPYVKIVLKDVGLTADIVPAFHITDSTQRISAVDRTQLHNVFVNKNLTPKQKDEVILLKAFLKAHNIYGAGAEVEGFSGYLCELLIHQYGSLLELLSRMAMLHLPVIIDPLNKKEYDGGYNDAVKGFVKKFSKEFIVIDPTDPNRNVAAVVSNECLGRLILISGILLRRPSLDFFYGTRFSDVYSSRKVEKLSRELGLDIYTLHFNVPEIAEDILWQQVRRLSQKIQHILAENSFDVVLSLENISKNDAIISLFIGGAYPRHFAAIGPSVLMGHPVEKFLDAHSNSIGLFLYGDKLVALERPRFRHPKELFDSLIEGKEVFPSYINKKSARMYVNEMPEGVAKMLFYAYMKKTSI